MQHAQFILAIISLASFVLLVITFILVGWLVTRPDNMLDTIVAIVIVVSGILYCVCTLTNAILCLL